MLRGPLNSSECEQIATLVEKGLENWRTFHERFHSAHNLATPDPGEATWTDLQLFAQQHAKAKKAHGFSALRFEQRNRREIISALEDIPVLELPDGSFIACADVGGRPILGPAGTRVKPAGLNLPALSTALRSAAFPSETVGAAFLRWSTDFPRPQVLPDGAIAVLVIVRLSVRRDYGSGWAEHGNQMHLWILDQQGKSQEIQGQELGQLIRSLINATVRVKPEMHSNLLDGIGSLQNELTETYRRPAESDIELGIRYAVLPLFAAIVTD